MDLNESLEELERSISSMCDEDLTSNVECQEKGMEYEQLVMDIIEMCKQDGANDCSNNKTTQGEKSGEDSYKNNNNSISEEKELKENNYKQFAEWLAQEYEIHESEESEIKQIEITLENGLSPTEDACHVDVNTDVEIIQQGNIDDGGNNTLQEGSNNDDLDNVIVSRELKPAQNNILNYKLSDSDELPNSQLTIEEKSPRSDLLEVKVIETECMNSKSESENNSEVPKSSVWIESDQNEAGEMLPMVSENKFLFKLSSDAPKNYSNLEKDEDAQVQNSSEFKEIESSESIKALVFNMELVDSEFDDIEIDLTESDTPESLKNYENPFAELIKSPIVYSIKSEVPLVAKIDPEICQKSNNVQRENKIENTSAQTSSEKIKIVQNVPHAIKSEPFISEDPQENDDNNNPEWQIMRMLETDDERYKAVRKKWKNLRIPDPNLNLTTHNYRLRRQSRQKTNVTDQQVKQGHKRCLSNDSSDKARKKMRTASCTDLLDDQIKKLDTEKQQIKNSCAHKFRETRDQINLNHLITLEKLNREEEMYQNMVNNRQLYELQSIFSIERNIAHEQRSRELFDLERKYSSDISSVNMKYQKEKDLLSNTREEIFTFHRFYSGLKNSSNEYVDATVFTETRNKEIMETDKIYKQYSKFYT